MRWATPASVPARTAATLALPVPPQTASAALATSERGRRGMTAHAGSCGSAPPNHNVCEPFARADKSGRTGLDRVATPRGLRSCDDPAPVATESLSQAYEPRGGFFDELFAA